MSDTETHPRRAPLPLWRTAEQLIRDLCGLFGEPQQIARQHTLTAAAHKLITQWLRGCEALLRQLLLMEAAAITEAEPLHVRAHRVKRQRIRTKRLIEHDPDTPEAWRVSFRVFTSNTTASRRGRRRSISARFFQTWPLAERAEALLRAFNDPHPYALRLARKLRTQPARAESIVDSIENSYAYRGVIAPNVLVDFWCASCMTLRVFAADSS